MSSKVIKYLVVFTVTLSLLSCLVDRLFPFLFAPYTATSLFSLSLWGIDNLFFWQFISYLFIYPTTSHGFDLSYLLHLFLNMFVVWRLGSSILHHRGLKHFLFLYLGSGLLVGIIAYLTLTLSNLPYLFGGPDATIFALLMTSILLYPEMELLLFLTFPIKAKWLIIGITFAILLIDLSNGIFLSFFTHLTGLIYGYLYCVIVFHSRSPFKTLKSLESLLFRIDSFFSRKRGPSVESYAKTNSKLYDFRTGERILTQEEFLQACDTKIALQGKNSLSLRERWRLKRLLKN